MVDDLEKETAAMIEKGFPVVFSGVGARGRFTYFDTRAVGKLMIELGLR